VQEGALHLFGGAEEPLADSGQRRSRRATFEQFGSERGFERSDPTADRGVVELQPLGRGDELLSPGDREKNSDVVPVHHA